MLICMWLSDSSLAATIFFNAMKYIFFWRAFHMWLLQEYFEILYLKYTRSPLVPEKTSKRKLSLIRIPRRKWRNTKQTKWKLTSGCLIWCYFESTKTNQIWATLLGVMNNLFQNFTYSSFFRCLIKGKSIDTYQK